MYTYRNEIHTQAATRISAYTHNLIEVHTLRHTMILIKMYKSTHILKTQIHMHKGIFRHIQKTHTPVFIKRYIHKITHDTRTA